MKPYQFYVVKRFPTLTQSQQYRNSIQLTITGAGEDVETEFVLENASFEQTLGLLRVKSGVKHTALGFVKTILDTGRQRIEFSEYIEPVDFWAYHDPQRKLLIFQAPKKTCRGVLTNLRGNAPEIQLAEMQVDFAKVAELKDEYVGAWFRGVNSRVHAAGLSGQQIQDDSLFRKLLSQAQLSNVTIPWMYEGTEHKIMITSSGALVLQQEYRQNLGLELRLILDVYDRLLSRVWQERQRKKPDEDVDTGEP